MAARNPFLVTDAALQRQNKGIVQQGASGRHRPRLGRDFPDRLAQAGFSVNVERPQQGLDHELVTRYGVETREELFLCTRS